MRAARRGVPAVHAERGDGRAADPAGSDRPAAVGGQYYGPDGFGEFRGHPVLVESNDRSHDPELQRGLWSASEILTGVTFPI